MGPIHFRPSTFFLLPWPLPHRGPGKLGRDFPVI
uniref:Uncharacterized protein n=1 Tax=Setaria italica TaxID=4555 RepID=K3Y4J3_SETIT